jgi:hypothetical protein
LFALLLMMALGIGLRMGVGMGRHLERLGAASSRPDERGDRGGPVDAIATVVTTPIQSEPAVAAATGNAEARSSDGAPCVPLQEPRRASRARPAAHPRAVTPSDARPDAGAPAAPPAPDLHDALRLLRAAQRSLREAGAASALSLLDEMARQVPELLVEEREVTRVLAYCSAHDVDGARRTAAALRRSAVASVYAHRLSQSCVGPEPAPAGLVEEMRRRARN